MPFINVNSPHADTKCVGYGIVNFASGENITQILGDLKDRFCGCTHVVGSIRIDLTTSETGVQELTEDDFNFFYYLKEISDVLTFTNFPPTSNITFPNLIIIRGEDQVPTAEGDNLVLSLTNTEIGALYMPNLREISQGDVLFLNVNSLCNYKTVNWGDILNDGRLIDLNTNCQPSGEECLLANSATVYKQLCLVSSIHVSSIISCLCHVTPSGTVNPLLWLIICCNTVHVASITTI